MMVGGSMRLPAAYPMHRVRTESRLIDSSSAAPPTSRRSREILEHTWIFPPQCIWKVRSLTLTTSTSGVKTARISSGRDILFGGTITPGRFACHRSLRPGYHIDCSRFNLGQSTETFQLLR